MNNLDSTVIQINGPVNVVRMEGYIENIKKVIYIFMDFHMPVQDQTACDNVFRKDIDNYLAESFKKLETSNKIYDFFMETWTMNLKNVSYGLPQKVTYNFKDKYIEEVLKLFRKIFKFNPDINKVSISEYFKNVRLHYLDIRTFFEQNHYFVLLEAAHYIHTARNLPDIKPNVIIMIMNSFKQYCNTLNDIIHDVENNKNSTTKVNILNFYESSEKHKNNDILIYLVHKMYYSYKHDSVKMIMRKQFDILKTGLENLVVDSNTIIGLLKDVLVIIDDVYGDQMNVSRLVKHNRTGYYLYGYPHVDSEKIKTELYIGLENLADDFRGLLTLFMDIYFMRRFLDKDYIMNGVSYTGAAHSIVYVDLLAKFFDFKVSHASYSSISDIGELNLEVRKQDQKDLMGIFFPEFLSQCSDVTNFPKNFE